MEPEKRPSSLLGSLRTAVKKVRFLLSFSATRWILSSIAGGTRAGAAGACATPRRLSFNYSRRPSLLDAEDILASPARTAGTTSRSASLGCVSQTSSAASSVLSRTPSSGARSTGDDDDDIDQRAEQFIANFYKQLQMERQVSLQLRYCRGSSLERTPSR